MARGPTLRTAAGWLAVATLGLASALLWEQGDVLHSRPDQEPFPHAEHAGLFPSCLACHAGIPEGNEDRYYSVTSQQCASCHDGRELDRVDWSPPSPRASNLDFSHPVHADDVGEAGDEALACQSCHGREPGGERMAVGTAEAGACLDCHAHRAEEHLAATTECSTCHLPVARTPALPEHRIAAFPLPAGHDRPDFLVGHGEEARSSTESCAVCHARESCTSCHLNGDRLAPIQALAPDSRVAVLARNETREWPEPASHDGDWYLSHGGEARADPGSCANCHARPSCTTCHTGDEGFLQDLPSRVPGGPAGALTRRVRPATHGQDFLMNHGPGAGASLPRCESCHREESCVECHASLGRSGDGTPEGSLPGWPSGDSEGGYHPPNFVLRHGAESFARQSECADCHSTEAFCRSCHEQMGMAREGRLGSASFHDAVPNWLLGHGRAARQNLESCASCHQQTSCLRCHSARSGWRVSPHGPGFDPDRVSDRSAISCAICHVSLPGRGGG